MEISLTQWTKCAAFLGAVKGLYFANGYCEAEIRQIYYYNSPFDHFIHYTPTQMPPEWLFRTVCYTGETSMGAANTVLITAVAFLVLFSLKKGLNQDISALKALGVSTLLGGLCGLGMAHLSCEELLKKEAVPNVYSCYLSMFGGSMLYTAQAVGCVCFPMLHAIKWGLSYVEFRP